MKLVTRAEFARICGVSKPAVAKAIKLGIVNLIGDGRAARINILDPLNVDYLNREERNKGNSKGKQSTRGTTIAQQVKQPSGPPPPADDNSGIFKSLEDIDETNLGEYSKADIDKFKAYEQAMAAKIKREEARGKLIDRGLVRQVFSKIYTVDNTELKTMEDKLTPAICGIFDASDNSPKAVAVRKLISQEVEKAMRHIKRIMNEHLIASGADEI